MGRYWAHGDPVMTFWFGSRPRVLGLTKRNQKAGTNCKAEKWRGLYRFEKPGWYWVQGTWLGWSQYSVLDENSDLLLCNWVKHSEWRSRSRGDGRRRCVCCWPTDASNLVVKVRPEVADSTTLRFFVWTSNGGFRMSFTTRQSPRGFVCCDSTVFNQNSLNLRWNVRRWRTNWFFHAERAITRV